MNYRKIYISIIRKAKLEDHQKGKGIYYELHHILPKSLFPLWKKEKKNLVLLTAREHFFCHQLLDKIYPGEKMFCALWKLANDGQNKYCIKGSREYEKLKIRFSKFSSNLHKGNIYCKGIKWSEEVCKKRGESIKGKNAGKTLYNNGEIAICIRGEPPEGFVKGNLQKNKDLLKGRIPWTKGKKMTDEFRKKLSEAHKGYVFSNERKKKHSERMQGVNTWIKGRTWYTNGVEEAQLNNCPNGWYEGRIEFNNKSKEKMKESAKKARMNKYWVSDILCIETNEIFKNFDEIKEKFPKGRRTIMNICKRGLLESYLKFHFKFI